MPKMSSGRYLRCADVALILIQRPARSDNLLLKRGSLPLIRRRLIREGLVLSRLLPHRLASISVPRIASGPSLMH
jgi:hypothetical protein